jgi:hypothetical protein
MATVESCRVPSDHRRLAWSSTFLHEPRRSDDGQKTMMSIRFHECLTTDFKCTNNCLEIADRKHVVGDGVVPIDLPVLFRI